MKGRRNDLHLERQGAFVFAIIILGMWMSCMGLELDRHFE